MYNMVIVYQKEVIIFSITVDEETKMAAITLLEC